MNKHTVKKRRVNRPAKKRKRIQTGPAITADPKRVETRMSCPSHRIPFPCAVYTRKRAAEPFVSRLFAFALHVYGMADPSPQVFSHMCNRMLEKELPRSLCVDDLRDSRHSSWINRALRQPVLVLVAGDVAQTVGADWNEARRKQSPVVRFLYTGETPRDSCTPARRPRFLSTGPDLPPARRVGVRPQSRRQLQPGERARVRLRQDHVPRGRHRLFPRRPGLHLAPARHRPAGVEHGGASPDPPGGTPRLVLQHFRVGRAQDRERQHVAGGARGFGGRVLRAGPASEMDTEGTEALAARAKPRGRRGRK